MKEGVVIYMRVESQVYIFNASIGSVVDEQERQTSRLVWWMVKVAPYSVV